MNALILQVLTGKRRCVQPIKQFFRPLFQYHVNALNLRGLKCITSLCPTHKKSFFRPLFQHQLLFYWILTFTFPSLKSRAQGVGRYISKPPSLLEMSLWASALHKPLIWTNLSLRYFSLYSTVKWPSLLRNLTLLESTFSSIYNRLCSVLTSSVKHEMNRKIIISHNDC